VQSRVATSNKNLRLVQEQLRHAHVQTTTGYMKITQQDIREGLETLNGEGMKKRFTSRPPGD